MTWNVQPWSSFSDEMRLGGFLPWGETPTHTQVFQGDTLIHDNPYSSDMQWKEVPAGNLPYRVVLDAERPADVFRLSTRTHTEWAFMSDTVDADYFEPFSVLQLDYRLESDLRGDVRAGAKQRDRAAVGVLGLRHPAGQGHQGDARRLLRRRRHLAARSTLTRTAGGWWSGDFKTAKTPGGFVSVRASAETDSGYSIEQEIIRAYGLR